jgi:ribosomal peptide maturation radical SAM protein 1
MMKTRRTKIALINMPFASLPTPSLGLSQLKTVLDQQFGERVDVEIFYLNHDFACMLPDVSFYGHVISNYGFSTGIGDWVFRQTAFPGSPDNTEEYFGLYYKGHGALASQVRQVIDTVVPRIDDFLDGMIVKYGLSRFDIVGFTSIFSQTTASVALARKLKLQNPDVVTLMGGPACTGEAGMAFAEHFDSIDYVFSGCGLVSLPLFLGHLLQGDLVACDGIDGVFSKRNVSSRSVGVYGEESDINVNVLPDYTPFLDAMDRAFPDGQVQPRLLFETSRGCWWGEKMPCTFCGLNGPSMCYRAMTPENALKQIRSILAYSGRCAFFASVDNIVPREYFAEVFPHIRLPSTHKIQYEVRANLEARDIEILCDAGVRLIQPGIEALSTSTLKLMNKGSSVFNNLRFLKICSKYPISMVWSLLLFSPGEKEDVYRKYEAEIPKLTHLHPPLAVFPIEYVRYSPYFENQEKYGLSLYPDVSYGFIYPFDEATVFRMSHRFGDANADHEKMRYWLDVLGEKVRFWNARWLNADNLLEAQLCLVEEDGGAFVYDSRLGSAMEYALAPLAREMLCVLEIPLRRDDLFARLGDFTRTEVEAAFGFLQARGLLFEEDDRYMSLVVL